jgi:two-component system cell cycle sensor histidine kinase/response regulator CckA
MSERTHVLVIDDEQYLCEAIADCLEIEGFSVLSAGDGEAGISLFQKYYNRIRLVLLDLQMPGVTGEKTLSLLRKIDPGVRVILTSGRDEQQLKQLAETHKTGFLSKPFPFSKLIDLVSSSAPLLGKDGYRMNGQSAL